MRMASSRSGECGRLNSGLPGRRRRQRGWFSRAAGLGSESRGALTFSRFPHLEDVAKNWREWDPSIRGAQRLSSVLVERWTDALLYRKLATLQLDVPVFDSVDELLWKGPAPGFDRYCERIQSPALYARAMAAVREPPRQLATVV